MTTSSHNTKTILKISARAFTNPFSSPISSPLPTTCSIGTKGGNPVTIFHFQTEPNTQRPKIPSSKLRSYLAKTCSWESVITFSGYGKSILDNDKYDKYDNDNVKGSEIALDYDNNLNRVWFYMPSGEEVSYCAHAAMAACSVLKDAKQTKIKGDKDTIRFLTGIVNHDEEEESRNGSTFDHLLENIAIVRTARKLNDNHKEDTSTPPTSGGEILNEVTLQIPSSVNEKLVDQNIVLKLLNEVGLSYDDIMIDNKGDNNHNNCSLPSFINSSVARNKTLIPLKSISTLHSATNPTNDILFRDLCDEIQSTGLYLYTPCTSQSSKSAVVRPSSASYECRQFPRFSGYPEDPATGIAAAALANSLYSRGIYQYNDNDNNKIDTDDETVVVYELFQGTAMLKPSRIKICFEKNQHDDNGPLLSCSGIVEVDELIDIVLPEL